jgi:hypothetical protein
MMTRMVPVMALLATLAGCMKLQNAFHGPDRVSVAEIVDMSRAGVPSTEIIGEMQRSGTVYRLTAAQLADLRQQGVSDDVIDYMQKTYLQAVAVDSAFAADDPWTMEDDGFLYGGYPYGWGPGPVWVRGRR